MSDTVGNYSSAGPSGNMSFNPYNKRPMVSAGLNNHNEDTMVGNNDTKMSNNEAFLAFLQKNDSEDDDNESNQEEQ
jgi:hypothetical protein